MRYQDFHRSPAGRLVPTVHGAKAFLPDPLPPNLDLGSITLDLANAMGTIGELRGACRRLPNPYVLIRPLQRLEAQTSSAMEGTHTTTDALALEEAGIEAGRDASTHEVSNYTRALAEALEGLQTQPISYRIFKQAHRRLLAGVGRGRGEDKRPGEYKRDQNMIGGTTLDTARFIPPPPREAEEAMSALERYINRGDKIGSSPLIDLALVHYQFETIHPFADGNGRVGRMLISLMAVSERLLELPVLYMSPEIERRKDDYIDLMYSVSARGGWTGCLRFFLEVLSLSCRRTVETIDRILVLQERYRVRAAAATRSTNMTAVVDMLFESPVIRPRTIVERIGITDAAARNLLRQLVDIGILRERRDLYPTIWLGEELLSLSRPGPSET